MNDITITLTGNLTADPQLNYTQAGTPVLHARVASTPRRYDPSTSTWTDDETTFLDVEVWAWRAEAASALHRGDRVLIAGRLRTQVWTPSTGDNAGAEQRKLFISADEIGPAYRPTARTTTTGPLVSTTR